jgi:hypothetical protein
MTVDAEQGVQVKTVRQLLNEDLRIPPYQRPYSWTPATALQLLDDVMEACLARQHVADDRENHTYVLGSVILYVDRDTAERQVVDGQQRLLTLKLLLDLVDAPEQLDVLAGPVDGEKAESAVVQVRLEFVRQLRTMTRPAVASLGTYIRDRCQFVRIETDDPDEAFRVFDSQNYRGKSLMPHDLLKAHHLRAMHDETPAMCAALVEGWESVAEDDLDRLFSTYLWRVKRWSRGQHAPRFTPQYIDDFKGIRGRQRTTPSARYHRTAQATLPVLSALTNEDADQRADGRARFQLEAPVESGRGFFEMADFMYQELRRLRREAFEGPWSEFASTDSEFSEIPAKARYRYVSELYLAALLYYTNKFGDVDLQAAKERLFKWAFRVRIDYQRVQLATIQNRASATDYGRSAFVLMRGSDLSTDLRKLLSDTGRQERDADFEEPLSNVLDRLVV